jgi:dTDP-glucose pyrophosphorylase/predicted transcriptional regulator
MRDISHLIIEPSESISRAVEIIDTGQLGIALVVDKNNKLVGIVTDVDIRKGIVKKICFDSAVENIMNRKPEVVTVNEKQEIIFSKMKKKSIRQIPVLHNGIVVGLEVVNDFFQKEIKKNKVVIMAGGQGKRLMPLTKNTPKPLLPVGEKPIIETILLLLHNYGFRDFYIMTNHLSEQIESFINTAELEGDIILIKEEKAMGTCGALSLLPKSEFEQPFLVMNADLLTNINFEHLFDFHCNGKAEGTMCVKEMRFQMPYGEVEFEGHDLKKLSEKPTYISHINAGIYVFNPIVLNYIPNDYFNMTDLFGKMLQNNIKVSCFPLREFWMDIGQKDDYKRAQDEYINNFR